LEIFNKYQIAGHDCRTILNKSQQVSERAGGPIGRLADQRLIPKKKNNKAKCRPGGILRILAGKNVFSTADELNDRLICCYGRLILYVTLPDRKELIKIISTRYLLISLITRKYLVDMILINLSGRVYARARQPKICTSKQSREGSCTRFPSDQRDQYVSSRYDFDQLFPVGK
jgi:hypothetical protein